MSTIKLMKNDFSVNKEYEKLIKERKKLNKIIKLYKNYPSKLLYENELNTFLQNRNKYETSIFITNYEFTKITIELTKDESVVYLSNLDLYKRKIYHLLYNKKINGVIKRQLMDGTIETIPLNEMYLTNVNLNLDV